MRYGALNTRLKRLQPLGEQEVYTFSDPEKAKAFEKKLIRERGETSTEDALIIILPARA